MPTEVVGRPGPSWLIAAFALAAITIAGFAVGRGLTGSTAEADDPASTLNEGGSDGGPAAPARDPGSTPIPGATPDRSQPEWYVPYLNQEQAAPKFRGELNGIELGATAGPLPQCGRTQIEPGWEDAISGTPFDLHLDRLPPRLSLFGTPSVGRCGDDGRVIWVIARLEVAPGPEVNGPAGVVQISRWETVRWYSQRFLADRVTAGEVAGRPAVFADLGLSGFGQTAVFVIDDEIGGSTMLLSTDVSLDYLKMLAEEMHR